MYVCVLSGGLAGHVHGTAAYDVSVDSEPAGARPYFWQALRYRSAAYMKSLARFVIVRALPPTLKYQPGVIATDGPAAGKKRLTGPGSFKLNIGSSVGWKIEVREA